LVSGGAPDRTLSIDRALRRILVAVIDEAGRRDARADLGAIEGPVIVIRSAPWPVLRAVLAVLKANERVHPVSVLCHRRDEAALAAVARDVALDLEPIFYPRFEPFNTATLRRLLDGGPWRSTVVLDGSKEGRGDALEHVTTAVSSRDACVWNAGGAAWRQPSLRERLDPASYALVRDLLRWRARRPV
jgi:hypothetical protein